jgi:hypothetical protein
MDAFAKARESIESDAEECGCGKDAKTYSLLGLIDAGLDNISNK